MTGEAMSELPYPTDKGRTHYPGCWRDRGHHNCAVAEADRYREAMERCRDWIMFQASSDSGIRAEIDRILNPEADDES